MDIEKCRINMSVRSIDGRTGKIVSLFSDGEARVNFGPGRDSYIREHASDLTPVSDPCSDCQKIASMDKCCEYWMTECREARRNASYWREELFKLQREAMPYSKPLGEAAKIHVIPSIEKHLAKLAEFSWEPEKLLMSQEARRVIEFLEASGSRTVQRIAGNLDLPTWQVLDAIIEAREAGKITLANGEYEIVRD